MGILEKMLRQTAVYWPPEQKDSFGRTTFGEPVEIAVRWEDGYAETVDSGTAVQGFKPSRTVQAFSATVYVPELPGGGEVAVGGYLWLGALADADESPTANAGAVQVKSFSKLPTLKGTKFLRTAMVA